MATDEVVRERLALKTNEELVELLRRRDLEEWRPEVFGIAEQILQDRGLEASVVSPGPEALEDTGAVDGLVPLVSFASVVESEACRSALTAAGFDVEALNEYVLQVDPAIAPVLGGLVLAVPGSQLEDARALLAAAASGQLAEGTLECPSCYSAAVRSERRVSRAGTVANYLIFGMPIADGTVWFKCDGCGNAWQ
jgi:hypothetical protein